MSRTLATCAVAAMLTAISAQANSITFTLTESACGKTCGDAPYGAITLMDNGTGAGAFVSVIETLAANEEFAGTGAGDALDFNIPGPVTIAGLPAGFAVGSPITASAFGDFLHSVTCTICQGGHTDNPAGPLSFTVSSAIGVTTASFIANGGQYFFASDIVGTTRNTGNVAALLGSSAPFVAPEPGTMALMLTLVALTACASIWKKRMASAV